MHPQTPFGSFESEFVVLAGSVHLRCLVAAVCWCGEVGSDGRRLGQKEEQCWVQAVYTIKPEHVPLILR